MNEQTNALPLDMSHTVISAETEKQMIELTRKPKRVRKFKDDYVEEVKQLTIKLHSESSLVDRLIESHNDFTKVHNEIVNQIDNPSIRFALSLLWKAACQKVSR